MSAAKAWFPLYVADFMVDTATLTMEQSGCYMQMLMYSWRTARLPDDDGELAELCRMPLARWRRHVADKVRPFFVVQNGLLLSPRLERERSVAEKNANSAREKSLARWGEKKGAVAKENKPVDNAAALPVESSLPLPIPRKEERKEESSTPSLLIHQSCLGEKAAPDGAGLFRFGDADDSAEGGAPVAPGGDPVRRESPSVLTNGTAVAFAEFWSRYPMRMSGGRLVKPDRTAAEKAFAKAVKRAPADRILEALARFPFQFDQPQYIPGPAVWLNKGQFLAEVGAAVKAQPAPGKLGWMVEAAAQGREGADAEHEGVTIDGGVEPCRN
ncbi:MAG TPA: YdaU family protein [Rhodocyclaceae bacterium]|nr:YdaU family protein [Rhodocyclaceae bacterium]